MSYGYRSVPTSALSLLVTGVLVSAFTGCVVYQSNKDDSTGRKISSTTLSQIQPGVTTSQTVIALLGEPNAKSPASEGGEFWRYDYNQSIKSSGAVLLIFGGETTKTGRSTTYIHVRDSLVVNAWQDTPQDEDATKSSR